MKQIYKKWWFWILVILLGLIAIGLLSDEGQEAYQKGAETGRNVVETSTPTPTVVQGAGDSNTVPTRVEENNIVQNEQPEIDDSFIGEVAELLSQLDEGGIGGSVWVDTEEGHIQGIEQEDVSWNIVKIHNSWPPLMAEFAVKNLAYRFINLLYTSPEYNFKNVGVTIDPKNDKYFRLFVGRNHANKLTEEEWDELGTTGFYNWVKSESTDRNEPWENRTFIEESF